MKLKIGNQVVSVFFYLLLFIFPFLMMIIVNESQRGKMQGMGYQKNGIRAMHSLEKTPNYCTWYCHNDTDYCIQTHNKIIKGDFLIFTNRIYFGIIDFLSSVKGGYQAMNIAFLVVGIPLVIWLLLIGAIDKYLKIKRLRK
jgi:hypothetical protein